MKSPSHVLPYLLASPATAFYIPFFTTRSYAPSAPIPLLVNKAYSDATQLQYAYADLPFVCPPTTDRQHVPLNLGEVLRGDRIVATSGVALRMREDVACTAACERPVVVGAAAIERARSMVEEGYLVEWIVDNLPGATSFVTADKSRKYYAAGFRLGVVDGGKVYLNNHHTIIIRYRRAPGKKGDEEESVIVGFEVYPQEHRDEKFELPPPALMAGKTDAARGEEEEEEETLTIPYTYSVYFREEESIEWSDRWDLYFVNQEDAVRVHRMAIVNSLVIYALLTAIVFVILARTIRSDIDRSRGDGGAAEKGALRSVWRRRAVGTRRPGCERGDEEEEALEDVAGWKLLNGDVFRPPANGHLLAPLVGSGMQLLLMVVGLVLLSAVGVLNPSFRGGFISFGVGLFMFAGLFSGYFSARIFRTFGGREWRSNAFVTVLLVPGLLFAAVLVLNLFVWAQASSTAIPFGTLVAMLPLVYAGSRYGFLRVGSWEHPTKTSAVPRPIPPQSRFISGLPAALLTGLIPFAVIFIELLFVFQSVWQDKSGYYYVFGFLAIASAFLVVAVAEVAVVAVYLQLCAGDHRWWWQSFLAGGGSAAWVFAYSIWYYAVKLHITGFVSTVLFFAYSLVACCVYGLLTGTVGVLTAYAFVRRIYG
ncbi:hypothetical protein C7999DRAFT_35074 [Corynascus novoguineensis]|uniref:Transmembrane 9 superfamily member n=1 Tax=Corynascus novoguineensis TaxID=1126955 RepID=A0AAN7CM18_9PEZI|nr:hypothetical protein C7999DRAFT_35074 [Corynascus novoguineensis]